MGRTVVPGCLGRVADKVMSVRGQPAAVRRLIDRSSLPIVLVDHNRRYVEVNGAARLTLRLPLAALRERTIDELTPPAFLPTLRTAWAGLMETGRVAGQLEVASLDGGRFAVVYQAARDALPGLHLIVFVPLGWPDRDLSDVQTGQPTPDMRLTAREAEVLQLAADGLGAPAIARALVVSLLTVRTHFQNIYPKLGVSDRAGAVACAMRLGLIE